MIHTYSNGTKHRISNTKIDLEPPMLGRPYIDNSYEIKEILSMGEGAEPPLWIRHFYEYLFHITNSAALSQCISHPESDCL